jgi:ankyrin repeat protein
MKKLALSLLMFIFLSITSCEGQENSTMEKPPNMGLHMAALQGNLEAVQQHIKAGSNLNEKDKFGSTALIIASTFGKTDVARALIEAGADINLINADGSTALITAAFFCRTEIVKALLEKGADKSIKNKVGSTAWDSVSGPYEDVKSYYDTISKALGPLGLQLDYEHIKMTRPKIAVMLK